MRLPEVAQELRSLARETGNNRLAFLADQIGRRKSVRSAPTSTPMSEELAEQIVHFRQSNPHKSALEIARQFNVNQGRVSEVLKGKRT